MDESLQEYLINYEKKKKKTTKTLIIAFGVMIVIVIIILLFWFVSNQHLALSPEEQKFIGTWTTNSSETTSPYPLQYKFWADGSEKKFDYSDGRGVSYDGFWKVENGRLYLEWVGSFRGYSYRFEGDNTLIIDNTGDLGITARLYKME